MRKKIRFFGLMLTIFGYLAMTMFGQSAFAVSEDEMYKRIMLNQMKTCMQFAMVDEIDVDKYTDFNSSLLNSNKTTTRVYAPTKIGTGNNLTILSNDGTSLSCEGFFMGDGWGSGEKGTMDGLFKIFNKTLPENSNTMKKEDFLKSIGYTEVGAASSYKKTCFDIKHTNNNIVGYTPESVGKVCWKSELIDALGVGQDSLYEIMQYGEVEVYDNDKVKNMGIQITGDENQSYALYVSSNINYPSGESQNNVYCTLSFGIPQGFGRFNDANLSGKKNLGCVASAGGSFDYGYNGDYFWADYKSENVQDGATTLKRKSVNDAYSAMRKWLTGTAGDLEVFSDKDKYDFYMLYLNKVYGASIDSSNCVASKPANVVEEINGSKVYYLHTSGGWCRTLIDMTSSSANLSDRVSGFSHPDHHQNSGRQLLNTSYDFEGLVREMATLTVQENELVNTPAAAVTVPEGEAEQAALTCASSSGAKSLGWIVCPVLDWLGDAATSLYASGIEPALNVSPELLTANSTHDGWEKFRDFANIIFIIFFLFVIFSQLTGYGIDNYGIKKILPKMIVVALLINLSYFICQALVDLSNILGSSLYKMFVGFGDGITVPYSFEGRPADAANTGSLVTVAVLAALVAGAVAIWQNPALLLGLLVSALGVVVSLFFLFVLLGARKAAVVVLTVLSPFAAICFMLPNTKNMFNKWWKFFYSLLLVYPIAGLLVGGGDYVSKLLMSGGIGSEASFWTSLIAMVAGIAPIFFIPTVLKTSLNMMGELGSKISNMGQKIGSGLQRGARNSDGFKNAQRVGAQRANRIKAGIDKNGNQTAIGKVRSRVAGSGVGRLTGMNTLLASRVGQANKDRGDRNSADAQLGNLQARTAIDEQGGSPEAYYSKLIDDAFASGSINKINSAIEAAATSGYLKDKNVASYVRNAVNTHKGKMSGTQMRDLASKYGSGFLATDYELKDYLTRGGVGQHGNTLGGYGSWAASEVEVDDIKKEDITRLSGASLEGMIGSGKLTQGMAQQIMADNPNISSDKKIMIGAAASGNVPIDATAAKQLAANHGDASILSRYGLTKDMVDAWDSATPQAVNIVQNNEEIGRSQVAPVRVSLDGSTTTVGGYGGSGGGSGTEFHIDHAGGSGSGGAPTRAEDSAFYDSQAVADEIEFVSNLHRVTDRELDRLASDSNFQSRLSDAARDAINREYDRRTKPGS